MPCSDFTVFSIVSNETLVNTSFTKHTLHYAKAKPNAPLLPSAPLPLLNLAKAVRALVEETV